MWNNTTEDNSGPPDFVTNQSILKVYPSSIQRISDCKVHDHQQTYNHMYSIVLCYFWTRSTSPRKRGFKAEGPLSLLMAIAKDIVYLDNCYIYTGIFV